MEKQSTQRKIRRKCKRDENSIEDCKFRDAHHNDDRDSPAWTIHSLITLPASQSVRQGGTVHGEVGKMDASDNLQATADAERSAIRNAMNVSVGKSSD